MSEARDKLFTWAQHERAVLDDGGYAAGDGSFVDPDDIMALIGELDSLSDKCVMYDIQLTSLRKETGELLARANIAETKLRAAQVVIANLEARAKNVQGPFITREPGAPS